MRIGLRECFAGRKGLNSTRLVRSSPSPFKETAIAYFRVLFLMFARNKCSGMTDAPWAPMLTALFIWMGVSSVATLGIVSAMVLGARRDIPTITSETGAESMILRGRGSDGSEADFAHSFAR